MNWEELVEKQTKDYVAHLESVKNSKEQLQANKQAVLSASKCAEEDLPEPIKDMLKDNAAAWDKEYGMYGSRFKEMRNTHQRELNRYFHREAVVQDLSKENDNGKSKSKSAGR